MLCGKGSSELFGHFDEIVSDPSQDTPFLRVPDIHDDDGVEVSVSYVAKGPNGETVLLTDLLNLPDGIRNPLDGDAKVLHIVHESRPPSNLGKGGDQALAPGPHLKPLGRIIIPDITQALVFGTDSVDRFDVLLDGATVSVDLNEKDTPHLGWDIEAHGLIDHTDGNPVQNLTRREGDAPAQHLLHPFTRRFSVRESGLGVCNILGHGEDFHREFGDDSQGSL